MGHEAEAEKSDLRYIILDAESTETSSSGEVRPTRKFRSEYMAWSDMRSRCSDPNVPSWKDYGGRGIKVCEEWESYEQFIKDVGPKPSPLHSLDRIDNDADYSPGNVRWATWKQQVRNRRNTKLITVDGVTRPLPEWCEIRGLSLGTAWARISRGWSDQEAIGPLRKVWTKNPPPRQGGPGVLIAREAKGDVSSE